MRASTENDPWTTVLRVDGVSLGGPTCAGRLPPVRCTLLRLAEHVRPLGRGRPRARRATRRWKRARRPIDAVVVRRPLTSIATQDQT